MALSTAADYKAALNGVLWHMDNAGNGIDRNGLPVDAEMLRADFNTMMADYAVYKKARAAAPTDNLVGTGEPGANTTTFSKGV